MEIVSSISVGSTISNKFNANIKSNFFFPTGWFNAAETKKSQFSNDFFLAYNVAVTEVSTHQTFLRLVRRKLETIPTDEPNSNKLSHDGKSDNLFFSAE